MFVNFNLFFLLPVLFLDCHGQAPVVSGNNSNGAGGTSSSGDDVVDRGGGGGGGRGGGDDRDKKDKFPNYLNHIPPEDDPLATRTLFTGNLELNITEEEMRRIFGRYGKLVDIDIKRPPPGTGNAYAFIRYENLDQAHRAKVELSGQYIGKFQCKIGYGKVNATPKVWIGCLGTWASVSLLEREFDRFGAIQKIEYHKGDSNANIYYETLEAAQAAVQEMRGFPLGGPDKRIRIDYSDLDEPVVPPGPPGSGRDGDYGGRGRSSGPPASRYGGGGRGGYGGGGPPPKRHYSDERRDSSLGRRDMEDEGGDYPGPPGGGFSNAKSVNDMCKQAMKAWEGGLILKNSFFPTKLFLVEGSPKIAEGLKDEKDDSNNLKITQRLRLDQGKLDDVTRRMNSSSSLAIFLGLPANTPMPTDSAETQSRPLRNLISYLKQKEAAGVISMNCKEANPTGVLYCFPPCAFSFDLLKREAPYLIAEETKDDHLVVLVCCGSNS